MGTKQREAQGIGDEGVNWRIQVQASAIGEKQNQKERAGVDRRTVQSDCDGDEMLGHSNRCDNEGEWHSKSDHDSRQKDEYEEISNEENKIH